MKKEKENNNIVVEKQIKDGKASFSGELSKYGYVFKYTLNEQRNGTLRGRIVVLHPDTEKPMMLKKVHPYAKKTKKNTKARYRSISFRTKDIVKIREYIEDEVNKIISDNGGIFLRLLKGTARPDTVTPDALMLLWMEEYLDATGTRKSKDENIRRKNTLQHILAILPQKPIGLISPKETEKRIQNETLTAKTELYRFLSYCHQKGYYMGDNPVTKPASGKSSSKAKGARVVRLSVVPEETLLKANETMLSIAGGSECGVALMESGYSAKDACQLNWADVEWDNVEPDFVLVHMTREDVMCPIHNYTRPVVPWTARILSKRFEALRQEYDQDELMKMPVVSLRTDPHKRMEPPQLTQEARNVLKNAGISDKMLKAAKESRNDPVSARLLQNTYKRQLLRKCGLSEDDGTFKFLLGRSILNDVTSANYVSFTDEKALRRLYTILGVLAP